jgi:hypothetical protein
MDSQHQSRHQLALLLYLLSQHLRLFHYLPLLQTPALLQEMVFPVAEHLALAPGTIQIKGTNLPPLIKALYQTTAVL